MAHGMRSKRRTADGRESITTTMLPELWELAGRLAAARGWPRNVYLEHLIRAAERRRANKLAAQPIEEPTS